jgi:hypothetical protein
MAQNGLIFQGQQPNLHAVKARFRKEFALVN